ncbi:MAG: antirestriction protein ArdA [Nitrososphaerota archaeon]|jgi:antirestriction protein|nr:antirestriction protein ArdA [Nitrososphaerota archaeon]
MCEQNLFKQTNPQKTNSQIRVYVANLGKYNEGEIVGGWLSLPVTHDEIKAFLKNQVGLNEQYEEYALHDYESDFSLGEYENLYSLNVLAVVLEQMSETEKNIASAYCSANGLKDTLSVANACMQVNDLSYVELDANDWGSKEEKLGYAILEEINSDLKATLEQCPIGANLTALDYFDFEKYGRDIAINDGYFASNEFFIFYTSDIDPKLYNIQEIVDQLNDPRLSETAIDGSALKK